MERIPPNSQEAERAVLGGLILDSRWYFEVASKVSTDDFYTMANRSIFEAISQLAERGYPVDAVLIFEELRQLGKEKHIESVAYLSTLTDDCLPSNCPRYAEEVHLLARRRRMIIAAHQVQFDGMDGKGDTEDYLQEARSAIVSVSDEKSDTNALLVRDTIDDTIRRATDADPGELFVPTGIRVIDEDFGGLASGLTTVIAGRPGMGKSTFLINVATAAALAGRHVYFLTLEDRSFFINCRLLARFADIDSMRIIQSRLNETEKLRLGHKRDIIAALPLTVDDGGPFTSDQARRRVAAHCARHKCDLVIIDHLSHVADKGDSEFQITTRAMRTFSEIPKECNVPLLLAAQLNRKVEERADKRPMMSDLRNSGEIEEKARAVWFLYRPHYYDKTKEDPNELFFIVGKANHGRTGEVKLWIDLPKMYIEDRSVRVSKDY